MNKQTLLILAVIVIIAIVLVYLATTNNSAYHCPTDSEVSIANDYRWINCMPGDRELSQYCQPEYSQWVNENCPNIQLTY
jgi:hypothetical protein